MARGSREGVRSIDHAHHTWSNATARAGLQASIDSGGRIFWSYAFHNITGTGRTAADLADLLLNEAGVAVLAGTAFGQYGEGHLRFSYANSRENISLALERMGDVLTKAGVR